MPKYRDGQEARVGDVVFGRVDHRPYPVLGIVSALDDDEELNTQIISLLGILVARGKRVATIPINEDRDDIATCSNLHRVELETTP